MYEHRVLYLWLTDGDLLNDYLSILKVRIGQYLTSNVYRKYELIQGFYAHLNKTYDRLKVNPSQDQ
nr:hypothetical protein DLTAUQXX_DLTAUQXX_CDS_0011 [uncultured phage]CAI9750054.1 hypothetical protein LUIDIZRK_LUIDIZRK_CDS_0011 [uncultured phage]